ncbi:ABC-type transport auxiliary lipoprotein family protein [Acidovorax sp. PRC11]|uniref:ABC-type transport auxiliary lipoprotein family protein n=1 Tax=Acidovorax sp. PRC11 TaxID=2962592 RepID=UPI002880C93B|nr:ABC-type transport auxiliary lipoprotein family protein [Acidovorax sp. PRC11]MDT0139899.1 ABC-type transport auxiliary lipoprotein family protein [Acidovorax sp. PRC11]
MAHHAATPRARGLCAAAATFATAALMAGCSALPAPPVRADVYDFGPGLLAQSPSPSSAERGAPLPPIALPEVAVAGPVEGSTAVLYRLAYDDPRHLRPYGQARWSQPPAQLVQQALRDQLGLRRAVLMGDEGASQLVDTGKPPVVLRVEIEEFSQVFQSPKASTGVLRLRASLADSTQAGEKLMAQRVFVVQRPAPTADARGGTLAMAEAAAQAAQDVAQWVERMGR